LLRGGVPDVNLMKARSACRTPREHAPPRSFQPNDEPVAIAARQPAPPFGAGGRIGARPGQASVEAATSRTISVDLGRARLLASGTRHAPLRGGEGRRQVRDAFGASSPMRWPGSTPRAFKNTATCAKLTRELS